MRDSLDISLEAAVRRYVETHPEPLAAVWSRNGQIRYSTRGPAFPWINRGKEDRLAQCTPGVRAVSGGQQGFTGMTEVDPMIWCNLADLVELFEQTRVGANGHAVTLLWATLADEDPDDDLEELDSPRFR